MSIGRAGGLIVLLYMSWLGMMVLHELGHVLHAYASGGRVERVSIPMLGFSETFYSQNPHPQFVAWGGAVWGVVLPLAIALSVRHGLIRRYCHFFAGFCLIANGTYIGLGWIDKAGDAGDLLQLGTPRVVLICFGACSCAAGLYLWHRVGTQNRDPMARFELDVPASAHDRGSRG